MMNYGYVVMKMSRLAAFRGRQLPWCFTFILLFLYALNASIAQGATCLVDDATGNDANSCCTTTNPCKTIQEAVNQANSGDTISVAAGTYPESVLDAFLEINKTLTVNGAQAGVDARTRVGPESIITDFRGTGVKANNVVIDGFTIQDSVQVNLTGYGIWLEPGVTGTQIVNNIFQNNIIGLGITNTGPSQLLIRHNLFQNNNQPGGASGTGIYTDQFISGGAVTNVLIEENAFKGNDNSGIDLSNTDATQGVFNIEVRNNSFDMNGRAFNIFNTHMLMFHDNSVTNCTLAGSAALRIFDGNSDVTIVHNDLIGGVGHGIRLSDLPEVSLGPSSNVRINFNNIVPFDLDGLLVDGPVNSLPPGHVGTVDAECNWWGDFFGPTNPGNPAGTGEQVEGDADFTPWFVGPAPDGPCGLPQGEQCNDTSQCQSSLFCADSVCCDSPCNEPGASCVVPGQVGVCVRPQLVPAASWPTQVAMVGILVLVGGFGLRAMRRRREG